MHFGFHMNESLQYWASLSGLDLAEAAAEKVDRFYNELANSTMYRRWQKAYRTFYGLPGQDDPFDISRVGVTGKQGELVSLKLNHAGSLAQHTVSLVSQTVPEFECVPTNSDYESLSQALFGEKLLDYFLDTQGVGQKLYDCALSAAIFGAGFLAVEWDPNAGPPLTQIDPLLPSRTKAGELTFRNFTPLDIVCDRFRYDADHDWIITRRYANRWDLIARYPVYSEEILNLPSTDTKNQLPAENRLDAERKNLNTQSDLVPLYTMYHRKSDALPNGKLAIFLSADVLLLESNLPYSEVPLVSINPRKMLRTPHGDSQFHHLLAVQDLFDNLISAVSSNCVATAVQLVMCPTNVTYSPATIGEGLAVLEYDPSPNGLLKPEALSLTAPNGESLRFAQFLQSQMETISGINATIRGSPPPNVDSGAFGALVAQQALTYAGAFQYSFQQAVARTGNLIIGILQQYADQPIVAEIAGEANRYQVAEFSKARLERIHRVTVRSGNPAARTAQFQLAMADSLLQKGLITDPKQYILLVKTGNLDQEIEADEAEALNVRRENELIRNGREPVLIATDNHMQHIAAHKNAIGDPSAREDPNVVTAGLNHIQKHLQALQQVDPVLLRATGQTPLPPPGPPPGAPPGPPGPPDQAGPQGPPSNGGAGPELPPSPQPANLGGPGPMPNPPNFPINPLSGQPWSPLDGSIKS